ncbi:pilus assembly protein [Salaquimonas pukyongi]|uniref:pilus assembly protein n=1 Tax=Salaquimonas pukyongi TaxID=2712698 RepID=UPI0013BE9E53|nr:pilus assembly protein [Salaquimonas pukyongi]
MIKGFPRDVRGNFSVILALAALPIMICAGVAVDYSSLSRERTMLQNSVDAAILAVGQSFEKKGKRKVRRELRNYLKANMGNAAYRQIDDLDIDINRRKHTLTVSAKGQIDTSFMMLAGKDKLEYTAVSQIKSAYGGAEVALVLDNTGSMGVDGKMGALKTAANRFVDNIIGDASNDPVKVGIVPFSTHVNVGLSNRNAGWISVPDDDPGAGLYWSGCVGSRAEPFNIQDRNYSRRVPGMMNTVCTNPITPLTNNKTRLHSEINSMSAGGNTYIPAGLVWGHRILTSKAPFSEGLTNSVAKRDNIKKFIVLMTDGANTVSADLPGSGDHTGTDVARANAWTSDACAYVKGEAIVLYTITFGDLDDPIRNLMRNCANSSDHYFHAASGAELDRIFEEIRSTITALHLSM